MIGPSCYHSINFAFNTIVLLENTRS
ncbi:hypothetical protein MPC1_16790001 [Methylocella tundrae]|nr:hypothetical protein MPC1_16790001 [Methylocella tundrae]